LKGIREGIEKNFSRKNNFENKNPDSLPNSLKCYIRNSLKCYIKKT
jgi:hypothetical protein